MQPVHEASRRNSPALPRRSALALCTLVFASISALPVHAESDAKVPTTSTHCPVLSSDAQTFLDELVLEMLTPGSSFSHLHYLGEPEMKEIQDLNQTLLKSDWGNLCKFGEANLAVIAAGQPEVVFIGDSITEFWSVGDPELFTRGRINRGISGQTSSQMLVRFWQDVVSLKPRAVHIMAGTNDLAENTGYVSDEAYRSNIEAMVTLAQSNEIAVVLASIPPAGQFGWRSDLNPPERISVLNQWLESYSAETGAIYIDYHSLLSEDGREMSKSYTHDAVHPHSAGYAKIRGAAEHAIAAALAPASE